MRDPAISPFGLALCILATLIAVPVLMASRADGESEQILAEASTTTDPAPTTAPTTVPTTAAPTTAPPTTAPPTTAAPTTEPPTTAAPTTAAPTTAAPTTEPPTTAAPTTAAPTTAPPTTAAPTTAAPTTAAPTTTPPTTAPDPEPPAETTTTAAPAEPESLPPQEPTAEQWEALRQCESSGNYQIVSRNGLYHGAYQFYPPTWDGVARSVGRTDLVGVLPSVAAAADQDQMALELWRQRGPQPWPHCGRHLPPKP